MIVVGKGWIRPLSNDSFGELLHLWQQYIHPVKKIHNKKMPPCGSFNAWIRDHRKGARGSRLRPLSRICPK